MKKNLLLIFAIPVLQLVVASAVFAQPWAEAMFQERRHPFGSVALGSESVYRFQFKNPYSDDIHIASVRSSCACTTPDWPKTAIKFDETAEIVAKLNTGGQFTGDRKATLTVVIDRPSRAEVQLQVTGYIRPDVVISPGMAEFGTVSEGVHVQKVLTLKYAGRPNSNWELIGVESSNPHIHVKADEVLRNNGHVEYKIFVTLEETMPSGYVHDMVRFTTNDANPNASVVMFPVHGFVTAPLVAKPSPLVVGFVQPGETIKKNIVLHSDAPFRITKIVSKDRRFQFAVSDDKNNSVHVLPIAFTADSTLGALNEPIIIHTTLAGQKQMQLLTQGMVYDASLFDEHPGRLKHQLAGRPPAQAAPVDLPPSVPDPQKIAGWPQQGSSRVQIRMGPTETAFQDATPQATTHTMTITANPEEKQSGEIAVAIVDAADYPYEADKIAVVPQEETLAFVPDLRIVPQLASGAPSPGFEASDTAIPPLTVAREPGDSFVRRPTLPPDPKPIPTLTDAPQPFQATGEAPFVAVTEPMFERVNIGLSVQATAVPSQNPDARLPSGFQVVTEETPNRQQPVSPDADAPTDHPPEVVADRPGIEQPAVEQTFRDPSPNSPLSFSIPSVKNNLEPFTGTKPQPVVNSSNVFAVVDDAQNAVSDHIKPLQADVPPKETRVISETPPAKIPPVPEMTPALSPGISPFTPTSLAPEKESVGQEEESPKISQDSSHRLSTPLSPTATNVSTDLDSKWIAGMFGGTGISGTANSNVAQVPPQDSPRHENGNDQDGLRPMELQAIPPGNSGAWNARLVTIAPEPEEELEYDEWAEEQPDLEQPDVILPPFERNPRWNASNTIRGQITLEDDLLLNMSNNLAIHSMTPGQGQLGPTGIVNGAPIPNGTPAGSSSRQPGPNRMTPNTMPGMSVQQLPPVNATPRPGNGAQRPAVQQPHPGNSQQTAPTPTTQARLTPQQMQQMQRLQQMQEMQRMQMQQRQAAAAQQAGRAATTTSAQQNRVATNPRPPQQQSLVVPPAPTVPNTPMMAPVPMFR